MILVNDRRHDFVAKSLDLIGRSRLRHDAKPSGICKCVDERVNRDQGIRGVVRANAESRICRGGKIDMKHPALDLVSVMSHWEGSQWPGTFHPCP